MLKFIFWTLLLINGGLLAYQQGYLASYFPDGREPGRMKRQINPASVKLLTDEAPATAAAPVAAAAPAASASNPAPTSASTSTPQPAVAEKKAESASCSEFGNFEVADATRFEQKLAALKLGDKLVKKILPEPPRNMVFIPPQGSKEAADKKTVELKRLGITDFFVIQEGEQRWGISLGIFRSDEAARTHLTDLTKKGVHSARLGMISVPGTKTAYQFKGLDAATSAALAKIKNDFVKQETRACEG